MSSYTSISIIYNPNSTGPSGENAKELYSQLKKHYPDLPIKLQATKYAGHAVEIAYKAAKFSACPLMISSSGDGGYNEVVNGAMKAQSEGAQPICAVLAAGNANDHSRTLMSQPFLEAVIKENIVNIDLLCASTIFGDLADKKYAHSYIGLGLTPVVAEELNKQTLNAFKELKIILKIFFKLRPFKIEVAGKILVLDSILFTNIGQMAKVLTVAKDAKVTDGEFEVIVFPHAHKISLIRKLFKASTMGLEPKKSYKQYDFKVLKKMPVQMDGEVSFLKKGSSVNVVCHKRILRTIL